MTLSEICLDAALPEAVAARVLETAPLLPDYPVEGLFHRDTWDAGLAALEQALAPDPDGMKLLTVMLRCLERTWQDYQARGLSREIFRDTMGCFGRFLRETWRSQGRWVFDRGFWVSRQISGQLLRIGTLEYELAEAQIFLHIPSDADLSQTAVYDSWAQARSLLGRVFPRSRELPMACESWLLSPELPGLLPASSRILAFQGCFRLEDAQPSEDYRQWVYHGTDLPPEALPEDTCLQRNLKAFLRSGGIFRNGSGTLLEPLEFHAKRWESL